MTTLQEVWEAKTLAALLAHKLREQGYELSESGKERIKDKLLESGLDASSIVLEDWDIHDGKCANSQDRQISLEFTDDDINSIGDIAEDMIDDFIAPTSEMLLTKLMQSLPSMLKEQRQDQRRFEGSLRKRWQKPLDLLELFVSVATEAGSDFNDGFRDDAARSDDAVFEALTRLHARACQVSSEVLTLLRSGYADGAHARWRTLHEIAVVSGIIKKHGQDLAERYLLHDVMQRHKSARLHQKYAERIGDEPLSKEEVEQLESKCEELVRRFGKSFKQDYGWAASVTGNEPPTFVNIEKRADVDHMRPYYRMASVNVHAGAHGAYFRLGQGISLGNEILLAGPSMFGLADPGHATAISLLQTTLSLLTTRPTMHYLVVSRTLMKLEKEIGNSLLKVHNELESSIDGDLEIADEA